MNTQERVQQLQKQVQVLKKELVALKKECEKMRRAAEYDFLTCVYNRHGFVRAAGRFLDEMTAERKHRGRRRATIVKSIALIFVDVDDLKIVNDRLGHEKGDAYIGAIARVLTRSVRDIDVVGRWGGDEFVIALINATEKEALAVTQKLKRRIEKIATFRRVDPDFVCSASFGLISTDGSRQHPNYGLHELIEKADKAMYEAKLKRGKGVIVSFSELME